MTSPHPDALTDWLRTNAHHLASIDPDHPDDGDLEPLLDIVGDARVVAVGESMHRGHEFLLLRHRILRFLVRRAGFTALVLESGFPESRLLDEWIREGGRGVRRILDAGVTYRFGMCEEMLDQAAWMRQHALTADRPVRFYGMDVPDSSASALPGVAAALELLDGVDPEYARHARDTLLPLFGYLPGDRSGIAQAAPAIHAYLALPEATRNELTARIGELTARMGARRPDYLAVADHEHVEWAIRSAEVARSADGFLSAMTAGATRTWPGANLRDAAMADSVEWILEREPRILIGAANGHVQKSPFLAPPFVTEPVTTVGQHLAQRLGADYIAIGTAYDGGEAWLHRPGPTDPPGHSTPFVADVGTADPASLDAALSRASAEPFVVDLRGADGDAAELLDRTTGTQNGENVQPVDARTAFDAMAFVGRISPWHTWL